MLEVISDEKDLLLEFFIIGGNYVASSSECIILLRGYGSWVGNLMSKLIKMVSEGKLSVPDETVEIFIILCVEEGIKSMFDLILILFLLLVLSVEEHLWNCWELNKTVK